jgi:hypothetical protein
MDHFLLRTKLSFLQDEKTAKIAINLTEEAIIYLR